MQLEPPYFDENVFIGQGMHWSEENADAYVPGSHSVQLETAYEIPDI